MGQDQPWCDCAGMGWVLGGYHKRGAPGCKVEVLADELLDPAQTSDAEVDRLLRELGADPEEIGKRGAAFVKVCLALRDEKAKVDALEIQIGRMHIAHSAWMAENETAKTALIEENEAEQRRHRLTIAEIRAEYEGDAAHLREERDRIGVDLLNERSVVESYQHGMEDLRALYGTCERARGRAYAVLEVAGASGDGCDVGAVQVMRWFEETREQIESSADFITRMSPLVKALLATDRQRIPEELATLCDAYQKARS